jgi:hypothetical protein
MSDPAFGWLQSDGVRIADVTAAAACMKQGKGVPVRDKVQWNEEV